LKSIAQTNIGAVKPNHGETALSTMSMNSKASKSESLANALQTVYKERTERLASGDHVRFQTMAQTTREKN